jgi:hypothetical protein
MSRRWARAAADTLVWAVALLLLAGAIALGTSLGR